jgi:hypothetical protein
MIRVRLFVLLLISSSLGCGIYSFKGSLPPHLKTVAIPLFENRTAEFRVAEDLTDAVIAAFTRDNSLKIAERSAADLLIEGIIAQIDDRAGAFDQSESVQDMKLYLSVQLKCTDQVKREVMWQERLTHFGSYDPSGGADARGEALIEAMNKICEDVLNKTVANW